MDINKTQLKAGQSIIEFCIGLIALLTVVSGAFQLGMMGLGRTNARVEATAIASARSVDDESDTFRWIRNYVSEVSEGTDGRSYSQDDEVITQHAGDAFDRILGNNSPFLLQIYAPNNQFSRIFGTDDMQASLGFVRATAVEGNIPVMPIVRRLFFDQNSIDVEAEVWSVHLGGLY